MIHASPRTMNPNMIGLNHTGFGACSRASVDRAGFVLVDRAMEDDCSGNGIGHPDPNGGRTGSLSGSAFTIRAMTIEGGVDPKRPRRGSGPAKRHSVSVIGVFGEVLITAGGFVLLFLGWQGGCAQLLSG